MDSRKPKSPRHHPKPTLAEEFVWLAGYAASLHALILRHDGKMPPAGTAHMAAERADEGVMEFYQRFAK